MRLRLAISLFALGTLTVLAVVALIVVLNKVPASETIEPTAEFLADALTVEAEELNCGSSSSDLPFPLGEAELSPYIPTSSGSTPGWLTPSKAEALTAAVRNALPPGSSVGVIEFDPGIEAEAASGPSGLADISTVRGTGTLGVSIAPVAAPGACASPVRRYRLADGTIIDTESAPLPFGHSVIMNSVTSYRTDGTSVAAYVTSRPMTGDTTGHLSPPPLTLNELLVIALAPGMDSSPTP